MYFLFSSISLYYFYHFARVDKTRLRNLFVKRFSTLSLRTLFSVTSNFYNRTQSSFLVCPLTLGFSPLSIQHDVKGSKKHGFFFFFVFTRNFLLLLFSVRKKFHKCWLKLSLWFSTSRECFSPFLLLCFVLHSLRAYHTDRYKCRIAFHVFLTIVRECNWFN